MIHSCCPGPLPAERTNKRGSSGVAVECRCVLGNAIWRNPLNTALSIRSSFGFCISYRILNIAQNLSAMFIRPRTELCSLAMKLSSLKQTFVPIISVFCQAGNWGESHFLDSCPTASWQWALQAYSKSNTIICQHYQWVTPPGMQGWQKSPVPAPHSTCWVQGWTFALTGHTLPVVSTLSMLQ